MKGECGKHGEVGPTEVCMSLVWGRWAPTSNVHYVVDWETVLHKPLCDFVHALRVSERDSTQTYPTLLVLHSSLISAALAAHASDVYWLPARWVSLRAS